MTIAALIADLVSVVTDPDILPLIGFVLVMSAAGGFAARVMRSAK